MTILDAHVCVCTFQHCKRQKTEHVSDLSEASQNCIAQSESLLVPEQDSRDLTTDYLLLYPKNAHTIRAS